MTSAMENSEHAPAMAWIAAIPASPPAVPADRIGELYHGQTMAAETVEIARKRIHWICSQCVGETVLDVGCSQGIAAILLAREGMQVTGLDTHVEAIRYATQATEREIASVQGRLRWIQGDLSHEALQGLQFDTLVLGEVIEHQALPERFLTQALRFAREGTRIVLTTPFGLHPHPDHKVELFPRHMASYSANGSLVVESLDVIDGYMRLVARVRRQADGARVPAADALLVTTERGTLASQTALYGRLQERAELVKKLQSSQKIYQRKMGESAEQAKAARSAAAASVSELAKVNLALKSAEQAREDATGRAEALTIDLTTRQAEVDVLQRELAAKAQMLVTLQGELVAKAQALDARQSRGSMPSERGALISSIARSCVLHEWHRAEATRQAADVAAEFIGLGATLSSARADAVRRSFSFQLGKTLLDSIRSWRCLIRMPVTLARQYREASRRRLPGGRVPADDEMDDPGALLAVYKAHGIRGFFAAVATRSGDQIVHAHAFARLAEQLRGTHAVAAEYAAREAYHCDPTPSRAKWLAFRLHDAGHISEPMRLLESLPHDLPIAEPEKRRWVAIRDEWLATHLPAVFDVGDKATFNGGDRVILVVGDEQAAGGPGGHLRSLDAAALNPRSEFVSIDFEPETVWPPLPNAAASDGQPADVKAARRPTEKVLDRLLGSAVVRAGRALEREVRTRGAGAIVVALDSPHALPALWASQRLGVALVCEVRHAIGRHSITREGTRRLQAREAFVLGRADLVIAATQALAWQCRSHLTRQVDVIVPPWTAPSTASEAPPVQGADSVGARPLKLGFYGDLSSHSGVSQLLHAVAQAKKRGIEIVLTIAGSGSQRASLQAAVAKLKLLHEVEFLGARTEEQARTDLADSHAVVFPAMAHGLGDFAAPPAFEWFADSGHWVIASDLPGHLEAGRGRRNVIMLEAGNRRQLADVIVALHAGKPTAALPAPGGEAPQADAPLADLAARLRRVIASKVAPPSHGADEGDGAVASASAAERAKWTAVFSADGVEGVIAQLATMGGEHAAREASELMRVAKVLREADHPEAEFALTRAAAEHDRNAFTLQALFWSAQRAKQFVVSCTAVRQLEEVFGPNPDARQLALLERFRRSPVTMLNVVAEIEADSIRPIEPVSGRICYVLHNTLPYTSGGYATRSHGIATALKAIGWDVVVLSRPGYPADLKPEGEVGAIAPVDTVDGIPYVRTLTPRRRPGLSSRAYVLESAAALEERIREQRPALVMAASNYITALPALIAARRTGVPFVYDVRGFWEITRLSRESDYAKNPNYETQRMLEALVAKEANHVFTLTEPMLDELVERGVAKEKIDLFPNSCDPTKFHASMRDLALAATLGIPDGVPVIGYIGTFVDYEGLDDLTEACAQLKREGIEFRLLLVGNENTSGTERGPIMQGIQRLAEDAGFADWLIMPGRIPHEQVEAHYSLIDIAPFPRKPWPVCEMVSPMKPLEAMAMEKAVLVSSVRALREMVRDEVTGLVFDKGDSRSLANALQRLLTDKSLRARLGKAGKRWVEQERTWTKTTDRFTQRCNELFSFKIGRQ